MFGVDLKTAKSNFFDRTAILNRVTPAEKRVLSKFGAFVRTTARSLIGKPKKGISAPGSPPHSHTSDKTATIRNILFSFDPSRRSVVIGPVRISRGDGKTPAALEYGGPRRIRIKRQGKRVPVLANFRPRPFMQPAFLKEQKQLPQMWRNAI
jgi:hypothetical protein